MKIAYKSIQELIAVFFFSGIALLVIDIRHSNTYININTQNKSIKIYLISACIFQYKYLRHLHTHTPNTQSIAHTHIKYTFNCAHTHTPTYSQLHTHTHIHTHLLKYHSITHPHSTIHNH